MNINKNAYIEPLKYRFTFVPAGSSYYEGYTVEISSKIRKIEKAFYIACESFLRSCECKKVKNVAVFYGDVESPEGSDTLYRAYAIFNSNKKINKVMKRLNKRRRKNNG